LHPAVNNPLVQPVSWRYGFYKRLKLLPWWLRYNIGINEEALLKDKIIKLGTSLGLQDKWINTVLRHAVSEFSKQGLGSDYYGYHNIDHELEATYCTLLSAQNTGRRRERHSQTDTNNNDNNGITTLTTFSQDDIKYLFVAALFHDYDPLKQFDKPHEDSVEWFLRNDDKIKRSIDEIGINIDIVIALIHRTAYPFRGKIAERANERIQDLFSHAGIPENDNPRREHYFRLGWFLSVSERIAGYALGNSEHAMELARRNAHALGWHPALINEESVKYFSSLKEEKEMFEYVLEGLPDIYKNNLFNNVQYFRAAWEDEIDIRNSIRRAEVTLVPNTEKKLERRHNLHLIESVLNIYRELPVPIRTNEQRFRNTLYDANTILITLRIDNAQSGEIVGYVKGGPLENYDLRRGTYDENFGKNSTAYMESISIKPGYSGANGGHLLRVEFLKQSKHRGYTFVTSYVHRNVIINRLNGGENIEIVQKYDPDELDYYRIDLTKLVVDSIAPSKIVPADIGLNENSSPTID
jgi:ribosomal protein S18 acetylase RimI-like enzyme